MQLALTELAAPTYHPFLRSFCILQKIQPACTGWSLLFCLALALARACLDTGAFLEVLCSARSLLELPFWVVGLRCFPAVLFLALACALVLVGCFVFAVCFACAVRLCALNLPIWSTCLRCCSCVVLGF